MVKILNLEALKAVSEESSIENINETFRNTLDELSEYLLLDAINSQVKIILNGLKEYLSKIALCKIILLKIKLLL